MTIVFLDAQYRAGADGSTGARVGVVWAGDWGDPEPAGELAVDVDDVADYEPGQFYKRELPCLIAGLDAVRSRQSVSPITVAVIDGNVRLDAAGAPGLGQHLFDHEHHTIAVIGVAKTRYRDLDALEVRRGDSAKPLYVTAAGMTESAAAAAVASMAGPFRVPTLIKQADRLSRT